MIRYGILHERDEYWEITFNDPYWLSVQGTKEALLDQLEQKPDLRKKIIKIALLPDVIAWKPTQGKSKV